MTLFTSSLLFLSVLAASLYEGAAADPNWERKLMDDLFTEGRYNKHSLPVQHHSNKTTIRLGVALIMYHFDDNTGLLWTQSWLRMVWDDWNLKWDKDAYGGVDVLRVPSEKLWIPDIMLYNSAENHVHPHPTMALIYPKGDVLWVPPIHTHTYCEEDHTYWPWDRRKCMLKFGSWTYDGFKLDLLLYNNETKVDLADMWIRKPWRIVENSAGRTVKYYDCCEEPYADLRFNMTFERQSSVNEKLVFVPSTFVILLTLATLCCSPDTGRKVMVGCFNFLIMTFMLGFFRFVIPYVGEYVPLVFVFHVIVTFLVVFAILESMLIQHLLTKKSPPPPTFKRLFKGWLGTLLLLTRGKGYVRDAAKNQEGEGFPAEKEQGWHQNPDWFLVATGLNRLLLLIYIVIVVILYLSYAGAA